MSDSIASPNETVLAVRKRPGMYVGDTDAYGLGHLARFAAERLLVTCDGRTPSTLDVCLGADDSFSALVDGWAVNSQAASVLLARVGGGCACPKKECSRPDTIDLGILSALSARLELDVWEGTQLRRCVAAQGVVIDSWHSVERPEPAPGGQSCATRLRFWPDRSIFLTGTFPAKLLQERLRDLAALRAGLEARWTDPASGGSTTYRYPNGLAGYVCERARGPGLPTGALLASAELPPFEVRCALLWRPGALSGTHLFSFANDTPTPRGGHHVTAFREALTGALTRIARGNGSTRYISADAAVAGLVAVVQVLADPRHVRFAGCTKDELNVPEVLGAKGPLEDALERALAAQPAVADTLLSHLFKARR